MAAAEILAIGTTALDSSDVTIDAGATLTVCLKDAAGPSVPNGAKVEIKIKGDNSEYYTIATLTGGRPALVITGAGIYRFSRPVGVSCGVFSA